MTDEGRRISENFTASMDKLKSSQDQYSSAYSNLNQISENLSFVASHTSSVNTNLNNEFSNWLNEKGSLGSLFDGGRESELNTLRDQFIEEKCHSTIGGLSGYTEPHSPIHSTHHIDEDWESAKNHIKEQASKHHLSSGQPQNSGQSVKDQYESQTSVISEAFSSQQSALSNTHETIQRGFEEENQKLGHVRLNNRVGENAGHLLNSLYEAMPGKTQETTSFESSPVASLSADASWFEYYANPPQI
jgi:hypothetical protein